MHVAGRYTMGKEQYRHVLFIYSPLNFNHCTGTRRACGGKIYHGSGTISPPVADEISYKVHVHCIWQIHGDTVQLVLQSTRFWFEPGCPNGRIEVCVYYENMSVQYTEIFKAVKTENFH